MTDAEIKDGEWGFAVELARLPEVWTSLLGAHTVDAQGCCSGCRSQVRPGVPWPCVLYAAAAQARRLAGQP